MASTVKLSKHCLLRLCRNYDSHKLLYHSTLSIYNTNDIKNKTIQNFIDTVNRNPNNICCDYGNNYLTYKELSQQGGKPRLRAAMGEMYLFIHTSRSCCEVIA